MIAEVISKVLEIFTLGVALGIVACVFFAGFALVVTAFLGALKLMRVI